MASIVHPLTYIAIRLPSGTHKVVKIIPDTVISLGKYGSFYSNLILERPYYATYEVLDAVVGDVSSELRIVQAAELHAEALYDGDGISASEAHHGGEIETTPVNDGSVAEYEFIAEGGQLLMKNNRLTVDDSTRQALSMDEIEQLKKEASGSGREIIMKIMESHSALDEKTKFSLAKYALRKSKKFLRRFTILPLDVSTLAHWMLMEKEPSRIMEVREEMLGLIASWSNVHYGAVERDNQASAPQATAERAVAGPDQTETKPAGEGRWLVVDDTGGLLVALMAERMGILHPDEESCNLEDESQLRQDDENDEEAAGGDLSSEKQDSKNQNDTSEAQSQQAKLVRTKNRRHQADAMSASSNTLTLIHPATQPNISLLAYFSYNPNETVSSSQIPAYRHPLHTHLKTLSWLQLLAPEDDTSYAEPELVPAEVLETWKSGKRGTYHRKRRRWERIRRVVDETRAGAFDGLVVASYMAPETVLHHLVPLLRGGAPVVVYSPNVEPLQELVDLYSSARKTAFLHELAAQARKLEQDSQEEGPGAGARAEAGQQGNQGKLQLPNTDFPLDPRLLLAPSLQTVRAREWQVLPGRTHPLMTGRGGPEGYLFTGTRVIPAETRVEARGRFSKKRKAETQTPASVI